MRPYMQNLAVGRALVWKIVGSHDLAPKWVEFQPLDYGVYFWLSKNYMQIVQI